jgi:hypothetical protein
MGKTISTREHDQFHQTASELSPKQHQALMKRMGITEEQDQEWHRTHLTLGEQRAQGLTQVDPLAIGAGFVAWCVKRELLVQRGKQHFATVEGIRELSERFEIAVVRKAGR